MKKIWALLLAVSMASALGVSPPVVDVCGNAGDTVYANLYLSSEKLFPVNISIESYPYSWVVLPNMATSVPNDNIAVSARVAIPRDSVHTTYEQKVIFSEQNGATGAAVMMAKLNAKIRITIPCGVQPVSPAAQTSGSAPQGTPTLTPAPTAYILSDGSVWNPPTPTPAPTLAPAAAPVATGTDLDKQQIKFTRVYAPTAQATPTIAASKPIALNNGADMPLIANLLIFGVFVAIGMIVFIPI